jgi:RimJ/RimL family protein N-acetyltransferase
MTLTSVYSSPVAKCFLYALLAERDAKANISHKVMPTWAAHSAFVDSLPYEAWYLIEDNGLVVGAVYLSRAREIGLFIFKSYQGRRYGHDALVLLLEHHPGPLLANVAIGNAQSMAFFVREGFEFLQVTLKKEMPHAGPIN